MTSYWGHTPERNEYLQKNNLEVYYNKRGRVDVLMDVDEAFYVPFFASLLAVVDAAYEERDAKFLVRTKGVRKGGKKKRPSYRSVIVKKWVPSRPSPAQGKHGDSLERELPHKSWWCRGHLKNQPYGPGNSLRKVIYVRPYLSGRKGSPLQKSCTVEVLG